MRIEQVKIENFRSHSSTIIDFDDYTALIGANGAGKSSVFYALKWFFDGGVLTEADIHSAARSGNEPVKVSVSVKFTELTTADKSRLGEYARGKSAHFSRFWSSDDEKSKVVGNSIAGPGFPDVRRETRVTFKRKEYSNLRKEIPDLPPLQGSAGVAEIDQALADWESSPQNAEKLSPINHSDANHLFGINGKNVIGEWSNSF
ncbi:AAA family ATPase [Paramicrobacterium fandaimingii]|uniref:AAA family ATPase n=1 Tax=Paramicrobacterium fandaimingii TaxID=2708079 RepID=UPI0014224AB7|nr:AAA family ATPase [Microbacterium fandaimingii]